VDQRAPLKLEDRFTRVAVLLVLPARILDRLDRERVLQLHRGHRDAVQAQRDIERLLGAWREAKLTGQPQAVSGIAGFEFRVQLMCRLEERRMERPPIALEAVPEGRERAVGVCPLAQIAEDLLISRLVSKQLGPKKCRTP
jgi:hypothetical protein